MSFKEELNELRYVPDKNRDKKMWKIYEDFLNKLHKDKPIFLRGLLSVIISEYQDHDTTTSPSDNSDFNFEKAKLSLNPEGKVCPSCSSELMAKLEDGRYMCMKISCNWTGKPS